MPYFSLSTTPTYKFLNYVPVTLKGTDGRDILKGREGNDTIYAGGGNDEVTAGGGDDYISAGRASDNGRSHGYFGADIVNAGEGNDTIDYSKNWSSGSTLSGGGGTDIIIGGFGFDFIFGGNDWDYLDGGDDIDTIHGDAGDDYIWGGNGDDYLYGDADSDTIYGGQGDDLIVGGSGVDTLSGGAGMDTFHFAYGDAPLAPETIPGTYPTYQERTDCITDWSFEDTIRFRDGPSGSYDNFFKSHTSGYDNAFWAAENYYIGGDIRYAFVADNGGEYGWLFADQDGNGSIDAAVMIEGANTDNFNWWDIA